MRVLEHDQLQKSCSRKINFGMRHAMSLLFFVGSVYGVIAVLALLLSRVGTEDQICLYLVHAAGALTLGISWKMGRWGTARYDSFGAALLLMGIAFKIHAFLDTVFYGTRFDSLYRHPNLPIPENEFGLMLKGEFITVSVLLLVACSWRLRVGNSVEAHSFMRNSDITPKKVSLLIYAVALSLDVVQRAVGASLGPFEQIATLLFTAGVAAIYFIAARQRTAVGKVACAGVLALPLSLLALGGGMKEEIFFPFIPAAIIFWFNFRQRAARIAAIFGAFCILAVSQLYVQHVRQVSWGDSGDRGVPTTALVSTFVDRLRDTQITDALDQVSSRVNMTAAHATTVTLADHYGHEPVAVFGLIPASVVPRVLWPGKPVMQPGAMHTARVRGYSGPASEMTSATAAGFAAELYLGGWWIGVVLGAILYGWMMAAAQQWALRFGRGFAHQVFCFVALYWTIRFDEKHVVTAYTSIIFLVIFVWILVKSTTALRMQGTSSRSR